MEHPGFLSRDNWLSEQLGKPAFGLNSAKLKASGTKGLEELLHWAEKAVQEDCFVFTKVDTREIEVIHHLEESGFRLVDTNVTFFGEIKSMITALPSQSGEMRMAEDSDKAALRDMASNSFIYSRFHLDPQVDEAIANKIKGDWVANYFNGLRGDAMVIALVDKEPAGFVQLLEPEDGFVIDLIAVAPEFRGQGVARQMIHFCLQHYKQLSWTRVGTQIANTPSINLYTGCGYRLESSKYIYHFHGNAQL